MDNIYFKLFFQFNLVIKIIYIYSIIRIRFIDKKRTKKYMLYKNIKEITHTIFFIVMSILMLYLFNPMNKSITISGETKLYLWIFAIMILIGINFEEFHDQFIHELS
jgi:hypothetical protein